MADLTSIRKTIKDSGITLSSIARSIKMPESTFKSKMSGVLDFSQEELVLLNDALKTVADKIHSVVS